MKKISIAYLLVGLILLACNSQKNQSSSPDSKKYSYSDGSGNSYSISSETFEYIPVKPEESSTGTYSGGSYIKNKPQADKFQKLGELIQDASKAKGEHTTSRDKGTGRVEIRDGDKTESFILKMGSSWQQQIETVLKEMKTSGG